MKYKEITHDPKLEESLWWVQRWVSGSLRDPDWEEDWLTAIKTVDMAFSFIQSVIQHSPTGKLYRGIGLSRAAAKRMEQDRLLRPFKEEFQSFSTDKKIAVGMSSENNRLPVRACVSAVPNAHDIMFSMADLRAAGNTNGEIYTWLMSLDDWAHQNEVVVRVASPLSLTGFEIL